jgi:hypothetical protein
MDKNERSRLKVVETASFVFVSEDLVTCRTISPDHAFIYLGSCFRSASALCLGSNYLRFGWAENP